MKKTYLLLLVLILHLPATAQTPVPYGSNPVAGHYQLSRGVKLYYETHGQGPLLLLLHGNGGNGTAWAQAVCARE